MNSLFERLTAADAARLAIETPEGERISYGDLVARTGRIANAVVALGVKPGDRVAVQVEKSVAALVLYLACIRCGAVYLPLNTGYTLAELAYFLGDSEPALVVSEPDRLDGVQALVPGTPVETLDSLAERSASQPESFVTVARDLGDLAAILYTSGTTGRSKGAMLSQGNLLSNAEALVAHWHFTPDDRLIHALPVYHTHGLFVATNTVLLSGAAMIFLPRFDPDRIIELMPRATVLMGVPTFYTRLLRHPGLAEAARAMRLFVSGSAPLLAETHRDWQALTGHAILERYGMTETNMNTSNPYDGPRVAGTVGKPLPGIELRIADAKDGIGMIEVRGPNVFSGYWRMPEKTAQEFRPDGFFITGDLGRHDENGYVQIVGRGKDLVITGGLNVYPKEVEEAIDALPGIVESAVIGLPHPDLGEGVTAVAVASGPVEERAVLDALTGQLAKFKLPKRVILVDELPRNAMGKVQKALLREQYKGLYE